MVFLIVEVTAQEQPPPITSITEPVTEAPPPVLSEEPELERPTVWGAPTEVQVLLYMIDLDEVNSAKQNFAASVYYEAR